MSRIVYRIRPGVQIESESDGRYRLESAGDDRKVRMGPPAVAPLLLVDGRRSGEEIERLVAKLGADVPDAFIPIMLHKMQAAGVLEEVETEWLPVETLPWPEHRCLGCGASCQGHWVGPLDDEFVATTSARLPALREKYPRLRDEKAFIRLEEDDPVIFLNSSSGQCLFLDDDMYCILHKEFGLGGKPTICQLFPFVQLEDRSHTRLGVGLTCMKHFDQVLDGETAGSDDYWHEVQDELDGRLFHFYEAGPEESDHLELIRTAADPLLAILNALMEPQKPKRINAAITVDNLAHNQLTRLERAIGEDDVMVALSERSGLFPERLNAIRRFAKGRPNPRGGGPRVYSAAVGQTPPRQLIIRDALTRFFFLRYSVMGFTVPHALSSFVLGIWLAMALDEPGERSDYRFGENLAAWMRTILPPPVRRVLFKSPKETDAFLAAFRRFWGTPS